VWEKHSQEQLGVHGWGLAWLEMQLGWTSVELVKIVARGEDWDWGKVCCGRLHEGGSWGWSFGQRWTRGALSQVLEQQWQGWEVGIATKQGGSGVSWQSKLG